MEHYLRDVVGFWFWGSVPLILIGGAASVLPATEFQSSWRRFSWMWATWTAFMACVPPRGQNFVANGVTEDDLFIYFPLALFSVIFWSLAKLIPAPDFLLVEACLCLMSLLAALLFNIMQGAGVNDEISASLIVAAVAFVAFVVTLVGWRFVQQQDSR